MAKDERLDALIGALHKVAMGPLNAPAFREVLDEYERKRMYLVDAPICKRCQNQRLKLAKAIDGYREAVNSISHREAVHDIGAGRTYGEAYPGVHDIGADAETRRTYGEGNLSRWASLGTPEHREPSGTMYIKDLPGSTKKIVVHAPWGEVFTLSADGTPEAEALSQLVSEARVGAVFYSGLELALQNYDAVVGSKSEAAGGE